MQLQLPFHIYTRISFLHFVVEVSFCFSRCVHNCNRLFALSIGYSSLSSPLLSQFSAEFVCALWAVALSICCWHFSDNLSLDVAIDMRVIYPRSPSKFTTILISNSNFSAQTQISLIRKLLPLKCSSSSTSGSSPPSPSLPLLLMSSSVHHSLWVRSQCTQHFEIGFWAIMTNWLNDWQARAPFAPAFPSPLSRLTHSQRSARQRFGIIAFGHMASTQERLGVGLGSVWGRVAASQTHTGG